VLNCKPLRVHIVCYRQSFTGAGAAKTCTITPHDENKWPSSEKMLLSCRLHKSQAQDRQRHKINASPLAVVVSYVCKSRRWVTWRELNSTSVLRYEGRVLRRRTRTLFLCPVTWTLPKYRAQYRRYSCFQYVFSPWYVTVPTITLF